MNDDQPKRIAGTGPEAIAIVNALGVDHRLLRKLVLTIEVGKAVTIETERFVDHNRVDVTALDSAHRLHRVLPSIERAVVELVPVDDDGEA